MPMASSFLTHSTDVIDRVYETGRKVANDFKENMTIVFDQTLPQWNYTAVPQPAQNQ